MPNHVHLVLVPADASGLRAALGEAHRRYTSHVKPPARGGAAICGRDGFASFPMDEAYLLACARYVELNPVRGGPDGGARRLALVERGGAPMPGATTASSRCARCWNWRRTGGLPRRRPRRRRARGDPRRRAHRPARSARPPSSPASSSASDGRLLAESQGRSRIPRRDKYYVRAPGSWRDPAGGSPAQVKGSSSLVASVASWKATTMAKRTQRLRGVGY